MESIKALKVKTKKKPKKEKEKKKFTGNGLRIIDDDSFGYGFKPVEDTNEDEEVDELPQIASVVDERPIEVQVLENFNQGKWKRVAATEDDLDLDGAVVVEVQRKPQTPDDFDLSPPRPSQNRTAKSKSNRNHSEDDLSPPRPGQRHQEDPSPPRRRRDTSRDASPVRKRGRDRDASPPRRRGRSPSLSPSPPPRSRSRRHSDDNSPPRRHSHGHSHGDRRDRSHKGRDAVAEIIDNSSESKRKTTLDGKKAGLQRARALKDEMVEFRRKENLMYEALPDEVSGRNATAVRRDRRTEEDKAKEAEKARKEVERQEQYNKWGKGIVQVKNQESRVQEALHEISKPLARYKNDEDLDEHLKAIDREGDPMLEYLASKKRRKTGGVEKPQYKGPQPPPNRFKIPPGYRWDGVDRSNGYEKEWFGRINAKKALEEEAHKWSVEDL